jgi:beta-galactosidase
MEIRTTGEPAALQVASDCKELSADGRAVAHLAVNVVDARGDRVPGSTNLISFDIEGSASLIGVDNGNATSHESYQSKQRLAYDGRCLAIIQSNRKPGPVRIRIHADGLTDARVELNAVASDVHELALP